MWNVYLPLIGYKHVNGPDGATLVPYLAQDMPTGLVRRQDLHADAPQGPEVLGRHCRQGERLETTIERDFMVDSPGVGFFGNIVGANAVRQDEEGRHQRDHHDDATGKITIKLIEPQGDFQNILATSSRPPCRRRAAEGLLDDPCRRQAPT